MRRIMNNRVGLVRALEEENIVNDDDVAIPEGAETLETELLETAEVEQEVSENQERVEDAVEVAEALESYRVQLEEAIGNGGLDRNGAAMMNIGLESARESLGITRARIVSLESFGGAQGRLQGSQVALEGIKEMIQTAWKAIIEAIQKAYKWFEELFFKYFGSAEKLEKRAKALEDSAANTKGKIEKAKIENAGLYKKLYVGSGDLKVTAELTKFAGAVKTYLSDEPAAALKAGDALVETFGDIEKAKKYSIDAYSVGKVDTKLGAAVAGTAVFGSEELFGGVVIAVRRNDKKLEGKAALNAVAKFSASLGKSETKPADKSEVPTLSKEEVMTVTGEVAKVARQIIDFRATSKKLTESLKKAAEAAKKVSGDVKEDADADTKELYAALRTAGAALPRVYTQAAAVVSSYSLNTSKTLLDYCELSLKQYKE